jgi:hypothetical protein
MNKYQVTVAMYTKYAYYEVEAENEDQAKDKAKGALFKGESMVDNGQGEWEYLDWSEMSAEQV